MRCKKCNSELTYDSKFCPYCGEAITKDNSTYEDPFKDIRINSHESQYNYQNKYSNTNNKAKKKNQELNTYPKDNKSLIGLILSIMAVPIAVFSTYLGIPIALIGFILTIVGLKSTKKGFGILSLILSIFTFISTILVTVFMIVGSIIIDFSNGYQTTIKNYFTDAFFCALNEYKLEGYWVNSDDQLLYLDDEDYYFYLNKDQLLNNYYYGYYDIEGGIKLKSNEKFYGDDDYFYYELSIFNSKYKIESTVHYGSVDLLNKNITLKLDKKTKKNLIMVFDDDTELEFTKR